MPRFVTFHSKDFVSRDDPAMLSDGFLAGEGLAKFLARELERRGHLPQEIELDDFAWTFYCVSSGHKFWIHVRKYEDASAPHRWLIVLNSTLGFLQRLRKHNDESQMRSLCWAVHEILIGNETVEQVSWFSAQQFNLDDVHGNPTPDD